MADHAKQERIIRGSLADLERIMCGSREKRTGSCAVHAHETASESLWIAVGALGAVQNTFQAPLRAPWRSQDRPFGFPRHILARLREALGIFGGRWRVLD